MSHSQTSKCDHCGKEVTYEATKEGEAVLERDAESRWFTVDLRRGNREALSDRDACSVECAFHLFEKTLGEVRDRLSEPSEDYIFLVASVRRTTLPKPVKP